jgi:guanyl-specific ribonuclease Sa
MTKNTNSNTNMIISTYGNGIAVGLLGDKASIQQTFNRFFNWGAAASGATNNRCADDSEITIGDMGDSYLHEVSDNFAYFLSTDEAMIRAIANETLCKWQDSAASSKFKTPRSASRKTTKKKSGVAFRDEAIKHATEEFNSYQRENFMLYSKTDSPILRVLDGGPSTWDKSGMTFGEVALTSGYKSRLEK